MSNNSRLRTFCGCGAILEGHFVLTSMRHTDKYVEKAIIYRYPVLFEDLCCQMANAVAARVKNIDVVVGPAPIGAVVAQRVAFHLSQKYHKTVSPLFTEKDEDRHIFRRNFVKDLKDKDVLAVDDVITTGKTIDQLVKMIIKHGGKMAAAAVICNRSEDIMDKYRIFPAISLLRMQLNSWEEDACPLCQKIIPISADIGRGGEFLAAHPGYPSK